MYKKICVVAWCCIVCLISCRKETIDLTPPQFVDLTVVDANTVEFSFNKPTTIRLVTVENSTHVASINGWRVTFDLPFKPGKLYELIVEAAANPMASITFKTGFCGHNPYPALVIFKEFTTRHSIRHKERISLKVLQSGDLAGLTLYIGQPGRHGTCSAVLPSYQVHRGDVVTLLLRPLADESSDRYDIFVDLPTPGLPNIRGIIILKDNPTTNSQIMDALAYVDGTKPVPEHFRHQLDWLCAQSAWQGEPIQVCGTSPTRSVIRLRNVNTKSKADWGVTATNGAFAGKKEPKLLRQPCL